MLILTLLVASSLPFDPAIEHPKFGFKIGASWVYKITSEAEKPTNYGYAVSRKVTVAGKPVFECTTKYGSGYVYTYFGVDDHGLWTYSNAHMSGPGVAADVAPEPICLLPFEKGRHWSWTSPFRGQTMGEVDFKDLESSCVATIVDPDVTITTPAGTFRCVHILEKRVSKGLGNRTSDLFVSPEIGLVRQDDDYPGQNGKRDRSRSDLVKFTPGS